MRVVRCLIDSWQASDYGSLLVELDCYLFLKGSLEAL